MSKKIASITIENDHTDEVLQALSENVEEILTRWGEAAEGFAKDKITENGSVDTGRLRNSITYEVRMDEQAVYIGSNVEYAPYVELGHSQEVGRYVPAIGKRLKNPHVAGKPFLKPAVTEHIEDYKAIMNDIISG